MAVHPWLEKVIGGVYSPRFLLVGDNLCTNPRMAENTSGWTSNQSISRSSNLDAFSEYMLKLSWVTASVSYVQYRIELDSNNKKFLVSFRIKTELDTYDSKVEVVGANGQKIGDYEIELTPNIKKVSFVTNSSSSSGDEIKLRIYGTKDGRSNVSVYIDDVYISEVMGDYIMSQPNESYINWIQEYSGKNEMADGKIQIFDKRWRPEYWCNFQYYEKQYEEYRQRVAEGKYRVFVFPNHDFYFGFFCYWDGDYKRVPPFGRFFGHSGEMKLLGSEYFSRTIHPIETIRDPIITYEFLIKAADTTDPDVESGVDGNKYLPLILITDDFNGHGGNHPPFIREYVKDTNVTLIAPETFSVATPPVGEGDEREFVKWTDNNKSVTYSTARQMTVQSVDNVTYVALYKEKTESLGSVLNSDGISMGEDVDVEISSLPLPDGYGYNYGSDYGDGM